MSFLKILKSQITYSRSLYLLGSRTIYNPSSLSSVCQHHYSPCNFTEFSKKTGDYSSLSAVDIQVMALTYQLEKEHVGIDHLHSEPNVKKVEKFSEQLPNAHLGIAGFYMPLHKGAEFSEDRQLEKMPDIAPLSVPEAESVQKIPEVEEVQNEMIQEVLKERLQQAEMEETQAMRELEEALQKSEIEEVPEGEIQPWATGSEEDDSVLKYGIVEGESEEEDDMWDDKAWITPENIEGAKQEMQSTVEQDGSVKVACITGDFAMQNVIKQMGLHVLAADCRIIKQLRTFILRCYACFKTTSKMDVLFCPHCGNKTLRRAAVLLKPDGSQEVQVTFRRPPTGRGKRFSLPKPQGGKHANNPILCADQRLPQQFISKLARTKNNPMEADYIAGYSPFVMRDVTSRSAMLGIKCNQTEIKNWMRRNPNEVMKKGKKKRR